MSAKGIFWLSRLAADGIKNGAFRVLFHLAQSHSDDKDPRVACYPAQATLMARTGLSNGSLNNALNDLEEAGFIRRRRTTKVGTKKQRTYYILGCDFPMLDHLPIDIDEDANIDEITNSSRVEFDRNKLQNQADQTPKKGPNKLQPAGEDNINNNTNRSSSVADAPVEKKTRDHFDGFYADLLSTLGVAEKGWWSASKGKAHVQRWLDAGLTEEQILAVARKNHEEFTELPDGPKALDATMREVIAGRPAQDQPLTPVQILAGMAEKIKTFAFFPASAVTVQRANELLKRGLVTPDDLRRHGIQH